MKKIKFKAEHNADRLYKIGEVGEFEDSKADNLVSVGTAEYVSETKEKEVKEPFKKEKNSNE